MDTIVNISKVTPLDNYLIKIKFKDGLTKVIDMKPHIGIGISKDLENLELFNKVFLVDGIVTWPNGYDMCPINLRIFEKNESNQN